MACPTGYRAAGAGGNVSYRDRVIEARFDDLSGAEPSFRLVEPVGVLEARRPAEVPTVIDAAEAAAARGLWVAGIVTYEAAPGFDPALRVRTPPDGGPFADLPLAWFALFEARQETSLPAPPERRPSRRPIQRPSRSPTRHGVAAGDDPRDYDAAIDRIHRAIAAGDTYQVNLTMPLEARFAAIPGACIATSATRNVAHTAPTSTWAVPHPVGLPELFFRIDGDRSRPSR